MWLETALPARIMGSILIEKSGNFPFCEANYYANYIKKIARALHLCGVRDVKYVL